MVQTNYNLWKSSTTFCNVAQQQRKYQDSSGMSNGTYLPEKVRQQIAKAGLPQSGAHPFQPSLARNSKGDRIIEKAVVKKGPRKGKKGFVDATGNIWIKDRAHAGYPDHWDV